MSTKRVRNVAENSTIVVQEDPVTGEQFIELPKKVLEQLGWVEGDVLIWEEMNNGTWSIRKKEADDGK